MRSRLPTALLLALPALAAAPLLGACGGTLYSAAGVPALSAGAHCTATQLECPDLVNGGTTCLDRTIDHCASCSDVCPASTANATPVCREPASGAGYGCTVDCNTGYLKGGLPASPVCVQATAISAGAGHACALLGDAQQTLKCWGDNSGGQVTGAPSSGDVGVLHASATGVSAVAAGGTHTCAVAAGALDCWGNGAGAASPALSGVGMLSAGLSHGCALHGTQVTCWGTPASITSVPALTSPTTIVSGANHACALDGGAVRCWGDDAAGQSTVPGTLSGAVALGAGGDQTCAAPGDRTLVCWGSITAVYAAAVARVNFDAVGIAVGRAHVCAHKAGDVLKCLGDDSFGQQGPVPPTAADSLTDVLTNTALAAAGADFTCAIAGAPDGGLRCFGANSHLQLGAGTRPVTLGEIVVVSGR